MKDLVIKKELLSDDLMIRLIVALMNDERFNNQNDNENTNGRLPLEEIRPD